MFVNPFSVRNWDYPDGNSCARTDLFYRRNEIITIEDDEIISIDDDDHEINDEIISVGDDEVRVETRVSWVDKLQVIFQGGVKTVIRQKEFVKYFR